MGTGVAGSHGPSWSFFTRCRTRRAEASRSAQLKSPEAARLQAAMNMHELGVRLYRQKMHREHPQAPRADIDRMVKDWLAEPPRSDRRPERDRSTLGPYRRPSRLHADHTPIHQGPRLRCRGGQRRSSRGRSHQLRTRGYQPQEVLEQDYVERLSGVRLAHKGSDVIVDLLFASSGIENEVVASADHLEVLPRLTIPVTTTAHLIALKVLTGRNQDLTDLGYLIAEAAPTDLDDAREAAKLIQARGFNREQDVTADLERLIVESRRSHT
jgi:hypothetical protein